MKRTQLELETQVVSNRIQILCLNTKIKLFTQVNLKRENSLKEKHYVEMRSKLE